MYKLCTEFFKEKEIKPYSGKGCGTQVCALVKNGKSDYKIVIPHSATKCERFSAEELKNYIKKVTNADIEIVFDRGLSLGGKYISVGKTSLSLSVDATNLNSDGFKIKSFGQTIVIIGERDRGTLYGVYDFLEKFLCVRFLADDFEYIPETDTVYLFETDITEIPSFAIRSHHVESMREVRFAAKMRMVSPHANKCKVKEDVENFGGDFFSDWSTDMHSYRWIVPYSVYGKSHPEWYADPSLHPNGKCQPVLSNGLKDDGTVDDSMEESYLKQTIENVKKIIEAKPEIKYFSLSQDDTHNFSVNPNCIRQRALFGGYGGQQAVFVNAVAREIELWLKEQKIEREIYFVMFAYQETHKPPIKVKGGKLVPFCDEVVARDNVIVMIAPYEASFNEPLKADDINDFNYIYYQDIMGWKAVCNKLFMFDYDINFSDYLSWYPNTEIIKDNLKFYKSLGVNGLMTNGASGKNSYQATLHSYLFCKLYWNADADLEELISEFNTLYFGSRAGFMIDRLVMFIRGHFKQFQNDGGYHKPAQIFTEASPWLISEFTLNSDFITECERLVDGAKWHIEKYYICGQKEKDEYLAHVAKVDVMIKYMKWLNYDRLFDKKDKLAFMKAFKSCVMKTGQTDYTTGLRLRKNIISLFDDVE